MSDDATKTELDLLRSRVAELEAAREKPQVVQIEGLEGLKKWSDAIENNRMDDFAIETSGNAHLFWPLFWGGIVFALVSAFVALASASDWVLW